MTPHEIRLALALDACTYPPGCGPKRFARDVAYTAATDPSRELTLRQRHYMEILAWTYRRQMPRDLIPEKKPPDLPAKMKPPKKERVRKERTQEEELRLDDDLFGRQVR